MKKVYLSADYTLSHRDGSESFALYTGIDALEGGWMLETSGDPVGLADLENADRCATSTRSTPSSPTPPPRGKSAATTMRPTSPTPSKHGAFSK